jgi:hypothetical protein
LAAGGLPELQAIDPHIYSRKSNRYPEDNNFVQTLPANLQWMRDHGLSDQLWVTETGYTSYKEKYWWATTYWGETEAGQAEKLTRMLILLLEEGATKVFAHDFVDVYPNPYHPEGRFGIMRVNSTTDPAGFEPKPAVVAYANLIHWLTGARWLGRYDAGEGIFVFAFHRPGQPNPTLVAWVKQGSQGVAGRGPGGGDEPVRSQRVAGGQPGAVDGGVDGVAAVPGRPERAGRAAALTGDAGDGGHTAGRGGASAGAAADRALAGVPGTRPEKKGAAIPTAKSGAD